MLSSTSDNSQAPMAVSRWHHYMDTHSTLLFLFVENPLVSGGAGNHRSPVDSHHKIPVIRIFYFSLLLWNKRLKKQSSVSDLKTLMFTWRHCGCIRKGDEDMSPYTGIRINTNFVKCFIRWMPISTLGTQNLIDNFATHCCGQRANLSTTTQSLKTDWH